RCTPAINERIELGCLGPALAIIILLARLTRRKHFKLEYCNGYPGLSTPVNFLHGRHNRFTIATTFGATAVKCLELFFDGTEGGIFIVEGPPWVYVFQGIITILVYGILFYPLFACMTTDHRLVGSLVGFLYATVWFSFRVAIDFQCTTSYGVRSNFINFKTRLKDFFFILLVYSFFEKFFTVFSCSKKNNSENILQKSESLVAKTHDGNLDNAINLLSNWGQAYFKLEGLKWSHQIMTVLISPYIQAKRGSFCNKRVFFHLFLSGYANLSHNFTSLVLVTSSLLLPVVSQSSSNELVTLAIIGGLPVYLCLIFILIRKKCAENQFCKITFLVGGSLRFSGYQIAYIIYGRRYLSVGIVLWLVLFVPVLFFKHIKPVLPKNAWEWCLERAESVMSAFIMSVVLCLFQLFLVHYVFRDRDFPRIVITVDNRRLFSIMSYFFFFNILVGLFSGFLRIILGIVVGLVFLARIDRSTLMQGFQRLDRGIICCLPWFHQPACCSEPSRDAFVL
ncbi:unnamed protein product, partial [Porites evermanni]